MAFDDYVEPGNRHTLNWKEREEINQEIARRLRNRANPNNNTRRPWVQNSPIVSGSEQQPAPAPAPTNVPANIPANVPAGSASPRRSSAPRWKDSITDLFNKEYGFDLDTKTRVAVGQALFGDKFTGSMAQNKAIYESIYKPSQELPSRPMADRRNVSIDYDTDYDIERDLFGEQSSDRRTFSW